MSRLSIYIRDQQLAKAHMDCAAERFNRGDTIPKVLDQLIRALQATQAQVHCLASMQFKKKPISK